MKRKRRSVWGYVLLFIIIVAFVVRFSGNNPSSNSSPSFMETVKQLTVPDVNTTRAVTRSIFIPNWQVDDSTQLSDIGGRYDRLIYFGVAGSESGIATDDNGYAKLASFVEQAGDRVKWLTVGMVNGDVNDRVVDNEQAQLRIVKDY